MELLLESNNKFFHVLRIKSFVSSIWIRKIRRRMSILSSSICVNEVLTEVERCAWIKLISIIIPHNINLSAKLTAVDI